MSILFFVLLLMFGCDQGGNSIPQTIEFDPKCYNLTTVIKVVSIYDVVPIETFSLNYVENDMMGKLNELLKTKNVIKVVYIGNPGHIAYHVDVYYQEK